MRDRARRFASVRWRVTAAAAVVSLVGLVGTAMWLVRSVESTLVTDLTDETVGAIGEIGRTIGTERSPDRIEVRAQPSIGFTVTDDLGDLVAASHPLWQTTEVAAYGEPIPIVNDAMLELRERRMGALESQTTFAVIVESPSGAFLRATSRIPVEGRTFTVAATAPLAQIRTSLDALQRGLWVAVPALVAGLALLAWFVTGRALRPVAAMTGRVEEITHHTLHERVPVPRSHDEVARLAQTMNRMLDRLEAAAERQRAFVSDASHELRSPVASIRTQLEVAARSPDSADWLQVAEDVLAEESRLEQVVSDLLALARLDEQSHSPRSTAVDLHQVVTDEAIRRRRLPIDVDVQPVRVNAPPEDLLRIVGHLLDNAVRHGESQVRVHLDVDGEWGRLLIDDDGHGIAEEDRDRVFARFTRLDEGRSRDAGGSGLGLAVVKALVESCGGQVSVDISPLGGARFEVRIPAADTSNPE